MSKKKLLCFGAIYMAAMGVACADSGARPMELAQVMDTIVMNNHTVFIDMSARMMDEAIWNRNRRLNKLWIDGGSALFSQRTDGARADGARFDLNIGGDWQFGETLVTGWTARAAYIRGIGDAGNTDVRDLNGGVNLYFLKTLNRYMRFYGNGAFDMHFWNVQRDDAKGDAVSYAATAEFGLIHDWLNQYIMGNLYLRSGYNFGFDITERAAGADVAAADFDGFVVLTPGYSLIAQKRIYPSAWLEMRPYVTAGAEYDFFGVPDSVSWKLMGNSTWSNYDTKLNPLWVNGGAGIEFLGVRGWHIGLDYRYMFNSDIQMHKLWLDMKYRF